MGLSFLCFYAAVWAVYLFGFAVDCQQSNACYRLLRPNTVVGHIGSNLVWYIPTERVTQTGDGQTAASVHFIGLYDAFFPLLDHRFGSATNSLGL
jgi:hypothetical protein